MVKPKTGTKNRSSVSQQEAHQHEECDPDERDAEFKLAFMEALNDGQIAETLQRILRGANQELTDSITSLRTEVRSLQAALADRDTTIAELRAEVQQLRESHDALEQHGRRHSLRISGIPTTEEDTTEAVVALANDVLKVQPRLTTKDISVSHRLQKPRSAAPEDPAPVIVRFVSRSDRDRVIKARSNLRNHNEQNETKFYINEDLTTIRARLFATVRSLQKKKLFLQAWTYNGNVKVKTNDGVVKPIRNNEDIKQLLPEVTDLVLP